MGLGRVFFAKLKKRKEFHQVLDFQGFDAFRNSFRNSFRKLFAMRKSLSHNAFTHFRAGGSRVGCQARDRVGLVLGLVLGVICKDKVQG